MYFFCDAKAELSAIIQSSVSHDLSVIILICWFGVKTVVLRNIFAEPW